MSAILLTGSRFAFAAILARRLSIDGFGRFSYAQWLVDIAFLVCSFGATSAVSRYVAEFRSDPRNLHGFIKRWKPWAVSLPPMSGMVALIGASVSGYELDVFSKLLLVLWAVASSALAMQTAALTGLQRFDLIFRSNLIAVVTMLAGVFFVPPKAESLAGLFALMALASGLALLPGLVETDFSKTDHLSDLSSNQWRAIRSYALNMWLVALLWSLLWSRGELPIVKILRGDAGVASYAAALMLFGGAIQGVMLGVSAVAPQLTRLWGEGCHAEAVAMARSVMDLQLLVCSFASAVLVFIGPDLLGLAFGENYLQQSETLAILSMGLVSMAIANQNHLLQIATDGRFSRNTLLLGFVILMGLALGLTWSLGLSGAAAARALTMMFLAGLSVHAVTQRWGNAAVSLNNIAVVVLTNLAGVFVLMIFKEVNGFQRCVMLIATLIILVFGIRDTAGNPKILVFRKIISARFSRSPVGGD